MGSCSSVHRAKRLFIASPKKEKPLNGENHHPVKVVASGFSLKSPQFGGKEEMFFDSKAWMDSDCEDDFFSVNGDFTPSRGSTPNNQTSGLSLSEFSKSFSFDKFPDSKSEPSPSPTGRKKLADLFQETSQVGDATANVQINGKPNFGPPGRANSVSSSELTPNRELKNNKRGKGSQCCLPILVQSFNFNERSEKMSPVHCSA